MKYTFLLPAYKSAFLYQALHSITTQTFCDFNVIVSDDCSPEPIKDVVDSFANDSRVRYRRNESNFGALRLVDHWNLLLSLCDSEYVIVASDDDVYEPRFLEEVDELTAKYPSVDLFHARANTIDSEGNVLHSDSVSNELYDIETFISHYLCADSVLCIGNYVFKTEVLRHIGGFVNFPYAWKSDTATQMSMATNGVANTSEVLFGFRMSGQNISSQKPRDRKTDAKKLDSILQFDRWLSSFLKTNAVKDACEILNSFRKRLEGEARSYYWCLDFAQFKALYSYLCKNHWFMSVRNKVSFILHWFRVANG